MASIATPAINVASSTTTCIGSQLHDEGDVEEGGDDACDDTTTTTMSKKKKTKKAKPPKPIYFKPSLDKVAIFLKDKEQFSFQKIIITPFNHNILCDMS